MMQIQRNGMAKDAKKLIFIYPERLSGILRNNAGIQK